MTRPAIAFLRRIGPAIRGRGGPEDRLVLLGLFGGAVFAALAATLFFVQRSLDRSQRQLAELAMPAEAHIAQMEAALNAAFRRQSQIGATTTTAQLEQLRDRRSVEEMLREAGQSSTIAAASGENAALALSAHVERFLVADAAFFGTVGRKHALNTAYDKQIAETDLRIHALVDASRSLSGVLRLNYVLQLRGIAGSLERGALRQDLVRAATFGPGRGARESTIELVEAFMELGWQADDVDDKSLDQLTSATANILPQVRARIERIIASLQERLATDPKLLARVDSIAVRFHELLPQIVDETSEDSLISLRRRVLQEEARAATIREETEAAARQLDGDAARLHRDVVSLTGRSVRDARLARTRTRAFSLAVALAGLLGCWLAARKIERGIGELTARNRSLTELKESLTTLNASLDVRVAERTQALSETNGRLKHEIVERQKVELELRLAQKLESLGRLAAGVAHEINTPVQFVSDSVHFVRDAMGDLIPLLGKYRQLESAVAEGSAAPAQAAALAEERERADLAYMLEHLPRALDRSLEGLGRIAVIVQSMKEFAHPDQKEMTTVDLNRAIESTLTIAHGEYKLVADLEMKLGDIPRVYCHAGEINQALLNLIVNSAHAIEDVVRGTDQKGLIRVETAQQGNLVVISISDTGGGIPPAIRDRIFDPFFTTKEVGKGTGQGLAIARSVIQEKHGGSLTFESEQGKGTTFTIRLPIDGKRALGPTPGGMAPRTTALELIA
jgi:signal transduction histidine kinase